MCGRICTDVKTQTVQTGTNYVSLGFGVRLAPVRTDELIREFLRDRDARGWLKRSALAQHLGVSPSTIRAYIKGSRQVPSRRLGELARFFGLTEEQLLAHARGLTKP